MPTICAFMKAYPDITLDLDFTDRLVDVIEEGFDAVVRTGEVRDTRLMSRKLGSFRHRIVASPAYLEREGIPLVPEDLSSHRCMHHRFANSGKLEPWPLARSGKDLRIALPTTTVASTLEPLIHLAENGFGITCLATLRRGSTDRTRHAGLDTPRLHSRSGCFPRPLADKPLSIAKNPRVR